MIPPRKRLAPSLTGFLWLIRHPGGFQGGVPKSASPKENLLVRGQSGDRWVHVQGTGRSAFHFECRMTRATEPCS